MCVCVCTYNVCTVYIMYYVCVYIMYYIYVIYNVYIMYALLGKNPYKHKARLSF